MPPPIIQAHHRPREHMAVICQRYLA
jgi:hypothetical protein